MNNTQLAFIYNGVKYVTLFGATGFLAEAIKDYENVADTRDILASGGYRAAFKDLTGVQVQSVPTVDVKNITLENNSFVVDGVVEIEGMRTDVHIDADGIQCDMFEEQGEYQEEVSVLPEDPEPVIKMEPEPEPVQQSVEQAPVKGSYDRFNPFAAFADLPKIGKGGVAIATDIIDNPDITPIIVGVNSNKAGARLNIKQRKHVSKRQEITEDPGEIGEKTKSDFVAEESEKTSQHHGPLDDAYYRSMDFHRVTESENKKVPDSNPEPVRQASSLRKETNVPIQGTEASTSRLRTMGFQKMTPPDELPKKLEPENEVVVSRATLTQDLHPDVIKLLNEMPEELFQPIVEFTSNPIDESLIRDKGHIYCIDNRWHRAGRWYCIDAVNLKSRYYYNSDSKIVFSLPTVIVKQWLKATP